MNRMSHDLVFSCRTGPRMTIYFVYDIKRLFLNVMKYFQKNINAECQDVTILCSILLIEIEPQDQRVHSALSMMQNSILNTYEGGSLGKNVKD